MLISLNNNILIKLVFSILYLLIKSIHFTSTDILTCPNDENRYSDHKRILAIENYPYKKLLKDNVEGIEIAMPQLESLIIRNDSVLIIEDKSFESLKYLLCLDLSYNELTNLNTDTFFGLDKLNVLVLRRNKLSDFAASQSPPFGHVTNLESLDLSDNHLQTLTPAIFTNLKKLRYLDLSQNKFMQIFDWMFGPSFESLLYLNVSNNPLEIMNVTEMSNLANLSVSYTNLHHLPAFSRKLQNLNVAHCFIAELNDAELESVVLLREINLSRNPWKCTCKLAPFVSWLNSNITNSLFEKPKILCQDPIYMLDKPVLSFNVSSCLQKEIDKSDKVLSNLLLSSFTDNNLTTVKTNVATKIGVNSSNNDSNLLPIKSKFIYKISTVDHFSEILEKVEASPTSPHTTKICTTVKKQESLVLFIVLLPVVIVFALACVIGSGKILLFLIRKKFSTQQFAQNNLNVQTDQEANNNSITENNLDN